MTWCVSALAQARPNVVIFLADDAGWGDYSHSGNTQVRTPHIDSLARSGVSLDRFFVQPCAHPRARSSSPGLSVGGHNQPRVGGSKPAMLR